MLRSVFRIAVFTLVAFLVVFALLNLFDAGAVEQEYTVRDLRPASLGFDNAYYQIWTLGEAPDADISSEALLRPIRAMFDPAINNDQPIREYAEEAEDRRRAFQRDWKDFSDRAPDASVAAGDGWVRFFDLHRDAILADRDRFSVLLARYDRLLKSPKIEDFTIPRPDAPLPNLVLWMRLSKLYTGLQMTRAADGDAEGAVAALIDQIDLCRRLMPNSRAVVVNLISKAVMDHSLRAVSTIISRPNCPAPVSTLVLSRLTPLQYEEYGTRQGFICEYLSMAYLIEHPEADELLGSEGAGAALLPFARIVLQRNRTKRMFSDFWRMMVDYEAEEPCRWARATGPEFEDPTKAPLWWMQNPAGKIIATIAVPNLTSAIYRSYRIKARQEMIRISAELNLKLTPGRPIQEALAELESYKVTDPYSGKPYRCDPQSSELYSVGPDRTDDGGVKETREMGLGSDFIVPLRAVGR